MNKRARHALTKQLEAAIVKERVYHERPVTIVVLQVSWGDRIIEVDGHAKANEKLDQWDRRMGRTIARGRALARARRIVEREARCYVSLGATASAG